MATFTLDLITGNQYLFSGNFTNSGMTYFTGITNANNGLTCVSPHTVKLGGTLTCVTTITKGGGNIAGIEYGGDYSASFSNRSLVDKGYVLSQTSGSTGSWLTLTDIPAWLTGTTLSAFQTGHTHSQYLTTVAFNTFSGTTLPANYYNKTQVNGLISGFTTGNTFISSGGTIINVNGNIVTIYSPTGGTFVTWGTLTGKPSWLTGATLQAFQTGHTHSYNNLTNKLSGGTNISITGNTINVTGITTPNLQQVTAVGAITTIESTFNGGLKTQRIRPTGDTITAIQVTKANGTTAIINIDSVSGFTGFGTVAPKGVVHAYGNNPYTDSGDTQTNAVIIDGSSDVDKDINWSENGQAKWLAETYRNENSRYWYLYNVDAVLSPITVKETGRIGINKSTNQLDYHATQIVGSGLNDLFISGDYTQSYDTVYRIAIVANGTPDLFEWQKSIDAGVTFGAFSSPSGVTTTPLELEYGVFVNFSATTGHTIGNVWEFAAFSQIPPATLSVAPMGFAEILLTDDYTQPVPVYNDFTTLGNGAIADGKFTFKSGTGGTLQSLTWGTTVEINSIYLNILTGGTNLTLIIEYWDGSTWNSLSPSTNFLIDSTDNAQHSGRIAWEINTFPTWTKAIIPGDSHALYWMRFRTSTNPGIGLVGRSLSVGNDRRFAVYNAFQSYSPSMYVDSIGRVNIGGGNITGCNKLQINASDYIDVTCGGNNSLFEINSNDSNAIDMRIRLSSDDACGGGLTIAKTRGTLTSISGVTSGDTIGHVCYRARVDGSGRTLSTIETQYIGNNTTIYGDLIFKVADNPNLVEKVRISDTGTGYGVEKPTAVVHLQAGSLTAGCAPLKFTAGPLLAVPELGTVEYDGYCFLFTVSGSTVRKHFASLESPQFSGNTNLPITTCLDGQSLCSYILNSGGTNNTTLVQSSTFNSFTGSTSPISNVSITGATNGLCKYNSHNIKLGGLLTEDTTIGHSAFDFTLCAKKFTIASYNGLDLFDTCGQDINIFSCGGDTVLKGMTTGGTESLRLLINCSQATFTDSRAVPTGVQYNANYSSTFTARSLVDKEYVDNAGSGLNPLAAVVVATTGNTVLSGLTVIGGVTLTDGMRILVKNQISGQTNGIYNAHATAWTRSSDFSGNTQVIKNSYVAVLSGTTNQNTSWILNTPNPIIVGTTVLTFVLFSSQAGVTAGNGICVTPLGGNNNVSIKLASNCGLCSDASGLYVNPGIAGVGLCYGTGTLCLDGSGIAGNSLSWTGTQLAVNTTGGTLSTALNSKLNTTVFNTYTGTTAPATYYNKTEINSYTASTNSTISNKLNTSIFNTYTGTTAPANYYNKTQINSYTGATATAIGLKANTTSPTFLVSACSVTPAQNDNSTCIATTAYYITQAGTASPLMDGLVCVGTSNLFSRQDHIHPRDTSKLSLSGGTMTGTLRGTIFSGSTCMTAPIVCATLCSSSPLHTGAIVCATSCVRSALVSGTTVCALSFSPSVVNASSCVRSPLISGATVCALTSLCSAGTAKIVGATTGSTLFLTTTPPAATILMPHLFWDSTTKQVKSVTLTGGSDSYFYTEKTTTGTTTSTTPVVYLSGTPWTFLAGRYQVDFNAQLGHSTAAPEACARFAIDGVKIGSDIHAGGLVGGWVLSISASKDITFTSGCHCLVISYWDDSTGVACMTYGAIRAKRIC